MAKRIYYLKFITPFRFGKDGNLVNNQFICYGDTFFSAFIIEWIRLFSVAQIDEIIEEVNENKILFSDFQPYQGDVLYLTKPLLEQRIKIKEPNQIKEEKKINFLSIDQLIDLVRNQNPKTLTKEPEFSRDDKRVCLNKMDSQKPEPFFLTSQRLSENSGFYLMVELPKKRIDAFDQVIESLGETGIGGKRSSGFGKFIIEKVTDLSNDLLSDSEGKLKKIWGKKTNLYLNLAPLLPLKEEIDKVKKGTYRLIQRRGFVYSDNYASQALKRKQVTMIEGGSCFLDHIKGSVVDLSAYEAHPVYRYGKGFFLGVGDE